MLFELQAGFYYGSVIEALHVAAFAAFLERAFVHVESGIFQLGTAPESDIKKHTGVDIDAHIVAYCHSVAGSDGEVQEVGIVVEVGCF